jgi:hypothetical protein
MMNAAIQPAVPPPTMTKCGCAAMIVVLPRRRKDEGELGGKRAAADEMSGNYGLTWRLAARATRPKSAPAAGKLFDRPNLGVIPDWHVIRRRERQAEQSCTNDDECNDLQRTRTVHSNETLTVVLHLPIQDRQ